MPRQLTIEQKKLALKKTLLLHNYDLFLDRQTRLFTYAVAKEEPDSAEISSKQELLLLDDLTIFSITARRLIDLCGLGKFSQALKVNQIGFEQGISGLTWKREHGTEVSFSRVLNRLIHKTDFECFTSRAMLAYHLYPGLDLFKAIMNRRDAGDSMEPIFFVKEANGQAKFRLKDIVECSVLAAEKIIETCNEAHVFLEMDMRNI